MAEQMNHQFSYTNIELFKSETIGSGSYGAVCKAKCDKLPCAAKLLYNTLLDFKEQPSSLDSLKGLKSHRTPLNRFKQECEFLSRVSHPNVVQYLGTCTDTDTNVIVLLMELMDQSLTDLIDNASAPIPLYLQSDIGHDVAMALTYLHSNSIIHRDLSSNNVLLMASLRAKVSDFGMSTIMGNTGVPNTLTLCPGNVTYMPPEALDEPPQYTKSLDVFSFGVLLIQINSQEFPSPSNRFTTLDVISPISHEAVAAKVAIPEVKRRITHIRKIPDNSPLLPIVLDCLRDTGNERPTAAQCCDRFEALKQSLQYLTSRELDKITKFGRSQSLNEVEEENIYELDDELPANHRHLIDKIKLLNEANEQLREKVEEMEQEHSFNNQLLSIRARELQKVTKALKTKEEKPSNGAGQEEMEMLRISCRDMEAEMRRLSSVIEDQRRENARYREQIHLQDATIADLQSIVNDREDYISSTKAHLLAEIADNRKLRALLDKRSSLTRDDSVEHESPDGWLRQSSRTKKEVEPELKKKEIEVKDLKNFIAIKDTHITSLQEQLQIMEMKLQQKATPPPTQKPQIKPRHLNIQVEWNTAHKAPSVIQAGSTAVYESSVYCRPANSGEIYQFRVQDNTWKLLQKCPSSAYTLVTIDGTLTAVGGMSTRKLLSYTETPEGGIWTEEYPPMSIERFNATAACNNNMLVVAGGFGKGWSSIADVEVLNVPSRLWATVQSLPYPIYSASATVCNETVYIVGGYFEKARGHFSVLSCHSSFLTGEVEVPRDVDMWQKIADLPVCRSTCVTFRGKLAAVGGRMVNGFHSSALYIYSANANNWTAVSDMQLARSECHAAVVNDKKLVVAGGYIDRGLTDDVEIGDIFMLASHPQ